MKIVQYFEISIEDKTFQFELRQNGFVWLLDNENSKSNFGQVDGVSSIKNAKELALKMLFISGRIKKMI